MNLSTNNEENKTVANFIFSKTLNDFETYLDFIDWFRDYIENYVKKSKSLQSRKINLFEESFKSSNVRKAYTSKTKFITFFADELKAFCEIQKHFFKVEFLIHYNSKRQLYVDFDTSDKDIKTMIYHVKKDANFKFDIYSSRKFVQWILFFSQLLFSAKTRYWFIELEIVELSWMLRIIKHIVKSVESSSIIYIDHDASLSIAKQTSLTTFFTNKISLRFIRTFKYIQRFDLIIRHKSERLHFVSNALSRLSCADSFENNNRKNENELDTLFVAFMTEMNFEFKKRLLHDYIVNSDWIKFRKILNSNEENDTCIFFTKDNDDIIYRKEINDDSDFFCFQKNVYINLDCERHTVHNSRRRSLLFRSHLWKKKLVHDIFAI